MRKTATLLKIRKGLRKTGKKTKREWRRAAPPLLLLRFQLRRRGRRRWGGTRKGGFFLKEFLHRSKSDGRSNNHKFWSSISFSAMKEKKPIKHGGQNAQGSVSKDPKCSNPLNLGSEGQKLKESGSGGLGKKMAAGKPTNGVRSS
ncbi:hypothetical protein ACFX2B_007304 [Malus domestica]